MKVSVIVGSLFVMLVAPVLASSIEPAAPIAESGGLRSLARELAPTTAQARGLGATALERSREEAARRGSSPSSGPAEESMTVSIDCDDRACVISSGLVVQVVASAPPRHANR